MKTCANRSTIKPLALAGAIALALAVSASAIAQQSSTSPIVTVPPGSLQNSGITPTDGADSTLSSQDSGQPADSTVCAYNCAPPPPPPVVTPPPAPPVAPPPPPPPPPPSPPPPPAAPNPPSPWLGVALPSGAYNAATILSDLCQGHAGFVVDIEPTGTITLTSVSKSAWPMTGSPYCGSPSNDAFTGQWLPEGGTASQYSVSVTEVSVSCLRANGTNCPPDIIGYSGSFVSGSTPQLMSFWTPTIGDAGGTDDAYFTLSITVRNNVTGATTTSTIQLHAMVDGSV